MKRDDRTEQSKQTITLSGEALARALDVPVDALKSWLSSQAQEGAPCSRDTAERAHRSAAGRTEMKMEVQDTERMLKWFEYTHLPRNLQAVSRPFCELAVAITESIQPGPERTVALRKLLESRDAAVRAVVQPGG